jgi:S-adenosylmethionine:tRNA ribosyltransferase-isomerase
MAHRHVRDLPDLLQPGDLVVANRSRVLPARVYGELRGGGRAELLLLRRLAEGRWQALCRPGRRLRRGDVIRIEEGLTVTISEVHPEGVREIEVDSDSALLAAGSTPLPPYIHGWSGDPERYQTVFGDAEGSAAAPTAGLHFTQALLENLASRHVSFATVVLHVGLDTFRPVTEADPRAHHIHREWYVVPEETAAHIAKVHNTGGRVVAVGTTVVRAVETWAATDETAGWTDLFILTGHRFAVVDALMTNFHLPRSSLLMLVCAFAGRDRVLPAYAHAISQKYRFYSFGDAMLIL